MTKWDIEITESERGDRVLVKVKRPDQLAISYLVRRASTLELFQHKTQEGYPTRPTAKAS
jgi:hypothetical protein